MRRPRVCGRACVAQVFQASARVTDVVGLANSGISADVAARMHKTQGIYSP